MVLFPNLVCIDPHWLFAKHSGKFLGALKGHFEIVDLDSNAKWQTHYIVYSVVISGGAQTQPKFDKSYSFLK